MTNPAEPVRNKDLRPDGSAPYRYDGPDYDADAAFHKDRADKALTDFQKAVSRFVSLIAATPLDHQALQDAHLNSSKLLDEAFAQARKRPAGETTNKVTHVET